MTPPIPADTIAREILEAAFRQLAELPCECDGDRVCVAHAAIEALEWIAEAEFVAGMLEATTEADDRCDS